MNIALTSDLFDLILDLLFSSLTLDLLPYLTKSNKNMGTNMYSSDMPSKASKCRKKKYQSNPE